MLNLRTLGVSCPFQILSKSSKPCGKPHTEKTPSIVSKRCVLPITVSTLCGLFYPYIQIGQQLLFI
jgi:hypothetical protein